MDKIEQLKQFLANSPQDPFLRHALALEYVKLGDDISAAEYFEANRQASPDYLATYYHYGKLQERQKAYNLAMTIYKEGIEIADNQNNFKTKNEIAMALEFLEDEL